METKNDFTSGALLHPRRCILIYDDTRQQQDSSRTTVENVIATMHDVFIGKDDRPVIGEGRCVDPVDIAAFARSLSKTKRTGEFLPENVLALSLTRMVWWHPSCVRRVWFKCQNKELDALNKLKARHPALLFDVNDGSLSVYALDSDKRPSPATQLYRAPYFNVSGSGHVQLCGVRGPDSDDMSVKLIPAWERVFYDSSFTHAAGNEAICKFKGGSTALWQAMCGTGAGKGGEPSANLPPDIFPTDCLIKKLTLAKLINEDPQD